MIDRSNVFAGIILILVTAAMVLVSFALIHNKKNTSVTPTFEVKKADHSKPVYDISIPSGTGQNGKG